MKRIVKRIVDRVRNIRNQWRYNRAIKNMDAEGTQLFIDIGSSSIKSSIENSLRVGFILVCFESISKVLK